MRRSVPCVLVLALSLLAAACDNGPEPTLPTTPPPTVTDTFTGSLTLNGATTHSFSTQAAGQITATLIGLNPTVSAGIGFSMGTWNGATCQAQFTNDTAVASSVLTGTTVSPASLCVRMHDSAGRLTDGPVTYTVQVVHP